MPILVAKMWIICIAKMNKNINLPNAQDIDYTDDLPLEDDEPPIESGPRYGTASRSSNG